MVTISKFYPTSNALFKRAGVDRDLLLRQVTGGDQVLLQRATILTVAEYLSDIEQALREISSSGVSVRSCVEVDKGGDIYLRVKVGEARDAALLFDDSFSVATRCVGDLLLRRFGDVFVQNDEDTGIVEVFTLPLADTTPDVSEFGMWFRVLFRAYAETIPIQPKTVAYRSKHGDSLVVDSLDRPTYLRSIRIPSSRTRTCLEEERHLVKYSLEDVQREDRIWRSQIC